MFKSQCMFLCFSFLIVSCYGGLAPFIDKCEWQDKACLKQSSMKTLPHICAGNPDLGVQSLDPLAIKEVKLDDGGLHVLFTDLKVTGLCNCKIINVERVVEPFSLLVQQECPIDIHGTYHANGTLLLLPVYGDGAFQVKTDKVYISVKISGSIIDGNDGKKFWKLGKFEHSYEFKEKALMKFDNLFNGDKAQADPVNRLLDQSWKDIVNIFGNPIVSKLVHKVVSGVNKMFSKISADELEY